MTESGVSTEVDVLIAGAGPTGLVTAIQLARAGVAFRLVEKSAEYFAGSRGDGIQPRTMEVFDDLGVIDTILATGRTAPLTKAYREGKVIWEGRMAEPLDPTPDVPYPNTFFVPQFLTEKILRDRLEQLGGRVELGTELVSFGQDGTGVDAVLRRGEVEERVRARYLVGSDGARSVVRRGLGVTFVGETDETVRIMLADVRVPGLDHDLGHVFSQADNPQEGFVAFTPLYGTFPDAYVIAGTPPESDADLDHAYLQNLVDKATDGKLHIDEVTWATIWRLNERLVERFQVGRVFLAGDAAHVHSPTGGLGLNTGIQDGYNLGWKLAAVANGASAELLDSYEAERLPIARGVLELSKRILEKHQRGDEDAHERGPEVRQLSLNYRGGPLARELRARPGVVLAGDRAPDAPGLDANGNKVRLFDLLRGPHWTVLAFGAEAEEFIARVSGPMVRGYAVVEPGERAEGDAVLVDDAGTVRAAYQVDGDAVAVIRPDGYLGLIADADATEAVQEFLRSAR